MKKVSIANWQELGDREPAYALVADTDLVVVRYDDQVSVLYGRCAHRGALMSDGYIDGDNIICGVHHWDYRFDTGVSEYNNAEMLPKFSAWLEDGQIMVDEDEIVAWAADHPQPYQRGSYQGLYQDPTGTADEPYVSLIRKLAGEGLSKTGHHGPAAAMGVPRDRLPKWEDLQFVVAQLHKLPLLDEEPVAGAPSAALGLRHDPGARRIGHRDRRHDRLGRLEGRGCDRAAPRRKRRAGRLQLSARRRRAASGTEFLF